MPNYSSFGCSLFGDFLPLQLIYQGKTTKCLPQIQFPVDWSILYTANHWSNEETTKIYITKIILPYLSETKRKLNIPLDHPSCYFLIILKGSAQKNCWSYWTVIMLMLFWYRLIAWTDYNLCTWVLIKQQKCCCKRNFIIGMTLKFVPS